ncbi:hypothetical protein IAT38_000480 [Cryptococcus sp. DSM 104549]
MSNLLNQAAAAASSVANTAVNTASNLANQAGTLANQAINSDAAATTTTQAKSLGSQAATTAGTLGSQAAATAGTLAGQAHAQAHALAPGIVPAPGATGTGSTASGEVDRSHDLSPTNEMEKAKFEKLFESRDSASELQDKGILKGAPGDALAGKRAELEKAMHKDVLDTSIAQRPSPEELVKKGILQPGEAPPAQ